MIRAHEMRGVAQIELKERQIEILEIIKSDQHYGRCDCKEVKCNAVSTQNRSVSSYYVWANICKAENRIFR